MRRCFMRTGLARRHSSTSTAIECVVEEKRGDPQLSWFKLVEDVMRVVSTVVVSYSRMIAAHNEMGAAVVFPNQRMKDGFARPGIAHRGRHDRKDCARG